MPATSCVSKEQPASYGLTVVYLGFHVSSEIAEVTGCNVKAIGFITYGN
jgi:hypothetical protein